LQFSKCKKEGAWIAESDGMCRLKREKPWGDDVPRPFFTVRHSVAGNMANMVEVIPRGFYHPHGVAFFYMRHSAY
jgi:hypothetical protein